jgi:hypothetical protein
VADEGIGPNFFDALHESAYGTELPIPNVRSSVANGGKADKICSMRVLRILTHSGHRPDRNPAAQRVLPFVRPSQWSARIK